MKIKKVMEELYNDCFSTIHPPKGNDVFNKDYNYREVIEFGKHCIEEQLIKKKFEERCVQFEKWCRNTYSYSLDGRLYKTTCELQHGKGIDYLEAMVLFDLWELEK